LESAPSSFFNLVADVPESHNASFSGGAEQREVPADGSCS